MLNSGIPSAWPYMLCVHSAKGTFNSTMCVCMLCVRSARGTFNPKQWRSYKYNLRNPVYRNTMWVRQAEWTAIRFKADNPGVWLLHCKKH